MKNKVEKIYEHAIAILENAGIKLKHLEILEMLKESGVKIEDEIAFFTREQIESAISKAPETFTLHAKNPIYDAVIGGDHINYTAGYGCSTIYQRDGTSRNTMLRDYIQFAQLVHQCNHFSINGGILAQPDDIPVEISHLVMVYSSMLASDKCLMGIPGNESQMDQIMKMAAIMFGGEEALTAVPRVLTMVSTISPLLIDETDLSTILISARYNQPMILSPASTAGTTGPIDLAGNMALSTAEALACIVIAQMIRPGVPVIFGLQCNVANLQTGNISIGSPGYSLQKKYTAEIARMLKVPSRAAGGATDSISVSPQSGYESMLSMFTSCQDQINLIVHGAGILDSYAAMSYDKFIMDLEIIDKVKYYFGDFEVNDETLNLDIIKDVGPGGQFLSSADTMKKCRSHSRVPRIGVRENYGRQAAIEKYTENIDKELRRMFRNYQKPEIEPAILAELDGFMANHGVPEQVLSSVKDCLIPNLEER